MARYPGRDAVYDMAERWRSDCLLDGESLLWPGEDVWSRANLERFRRCFIDRPDESNDSFEVKFRRQLDDEPETVTKLACEIVLVYFLFPNNVGNTRKRQLIREIASWKGLELDDSAAALQCFVRGIGSGGQRYNTQRPFEIAFIAKVALRLTELSQDECLEKVADHRLFRALLDEIGDEGLQGRHTLLHLLFPDEYERIASRGHKRLIRQAFLDVLDSEPPEDLDDCLLQIRQRLDGWVSARPGGRPLDFYYPPLRDCWYTEAESGDGDLDPAEGLDVKKQIVFYGPPGTGKTHEARALGERYVRQSILRAWGPKRFFSESGAVDGLVTDRVRRVQLHPGYGYEDLIRGLQFAGGTTTYRSGVLLRIVEELEQDDSPGLPLVQILDEMNRADLSRVLGECFSLLEDRDAAIQLSGTEARDLTIPDSLYLIGTMNLIDQSLEQIDFALRRRFLWFFRGFSEADFLTVARHRWERLLEATDPLKEIPSRWRWDRAEEEMEALAERAVWINRQIETHPPLGRQYHIGHTYFADVVYYAQKSLAARPTVQRALFTAAGQARDPVVALWRYSLQPLLEQYLSGAEEGERGAFIKRLEAGLLKGVLA
jgi:5-methylcytosine-specific restriction enzyme B